mgnify:CR=1 FL=1
MATLLTISDIQEYEPDILNYGVPDFATEITRAQNDVFRDLRIKWWPTQTIGLYDLKYIAGGNTEPDEDLYTPERLCINVWGIISIQHYQNSNQTKTFSKERCCSTEKSIRENSILF